MLDPYPHPAISVPSCSAPQRHPNGDEIVEHVAGHPNIPFVGITDPYPPP